jgi:hypothetical protein
MKLLVKLSAAVSLLALMISCSNPSKPFTERRIIIGNKETVKISELDLSITNNGCGRKWVSDGENPSYERPYCGLVIMRKDSMLNAGSNFDPVYIGNVKIEIDRMNPWGREEDSIPPGGCRVIVRKMDDLSR